MKDIYKINSIQIYNIWRNTATGLMLVGLTLLLTYILPTFLAPVVSTCAAFAIYILTYNEINRRQSCLLHPSAILLSLINYTFLLLILNIASVWITSFNIWFELSFFTEPFLPILLLAPVTFATAVILLFRGDSASVCTDCQITNGHFSMRGRMGSILHTESKLQLRNLVLISGLISAGTLLYFAFAYNPVNITSRDTLVFYWLPILLIIFDIVYFGMHYYNLYLDLREQDLVVTPQELAETSTKTWVRYYIICEDNIYLNMHSKDAFNPQSDVPVIETPFIVSRESDGITEEEASSIIHALTGVHDGRLRFFFGRKSPDNLKHSVVRFFYLLPGETEKYPQLKDVDGTWISSNKFKTLMYTKPAQISRGLMTDMRRLGTIVITSKTFDEKGERRTKLTQYHPSFNFEELYRSKLDFQDSAWLRVSCFNSDTSYFKIKRLWRNFTRRNNIPVDE